MDGWMDGWMDRWMYFMDLNNILFTNLKNI